MYLQWLLTFAMVLLCLKNFKADNFQGPNIALNQAASQSPGILGGGDAHYAVDGILANDINSGKKCAHTDFSDTAASWTVMLGRAYNITGIKLLNRKSETWRIRLKNFKVLGNGKELYSNKETTNSCNPYVGTRPNPSFCDETIMIPVHNEENVINITILVNSHKTDSYYPDEYPFLDDRKRAILTACEVQIFAIVCLLPNITNGRITPAMPYTTPNSTIRLTCNEGYRMDSETSLCTDSGVWNPLPTCNLVHCFVPGDIVNGNYRDQTQTYLEVNYSLPYQSSIYVACNVGFESKHESSPRQCLADGTWNGSSPSCDPVQCSYPDEILNGFYVNMNSGKTFTSESLPYLSNITSQCNEGYVSSPVIRTCLDNKTWSGFTPMCDLVYCSPPSELENGYYVLQENETIYIGNVSLAYATQLRAECYQGYVLRPGPLKISCKTNQTWTEPYPVCDVVSCTVPVTEHGVLRKFSDSYDGGSVSYNATMNETCAENYQNERIQVVRRCTETGKFDGSELVCKKAPTSSAFLGAVAGGSAGGALLVIVVAAVVVVKVVRRKRASKAGGNTTGAYENSFTPNSGEYTEIREIAKPGQNYVPLRKQVLNKHSKTCEASSGHTNSLVVTGAETEHTDDYQSYYSFSKTDKLPATAIKVDQLSDIVLSGDYQSKIKEQFEGFPVGLTEPYTAALNNMQKNRYKNMYPYDSTRVILNKEHVDDSDYINASFIHGFTKTKAYIAALGPTKATIEDFWTMVWQQRCGKIVMLTNLQEEKKLKCEQYWPESGTEPYGKVSITLRESESFSDFIIRKFSIKRQQKPSGSAEEREVLQFHFTAWPDKNVPKYASSLVHYRQKVKATETALNGPLIVHCSAGVGRTGTFIALDVLADQAKALGYVDVAGCVNTLRRQRVSMVQTLNQYIFLHHALVETLMVTTSAMPASQFRSTYNDLLQFDDKKKMRKLDVEFSMLRKMSPVQDECHYVSAKEVRNKRKNRYSNILPVMEHMPELSPSDRSSEPTYINAVYLPSYKAKQSFIITQTPLETTKEDFWKLVHEHGVHTIVMMNSKQETKDEETYWPNEKQLMTFGHLKVKTLSLEREGIHQVVTMLLNENRTIKQFQCGGWNATNALPDTPGGIISLLEAVQSWQQNSGNHMILVHCMNGAEKSGLFCVASTVIERLKAEHDVAISQVIEEMRNYREQIVSSVDQYQFFFELVKYYLNMNETYSNFTA